MKVFYTLLLTLLSFSSIYAQSIILEPGGQSVNRDSVYEGEVDIFGNGLHISQLVEVTDVDPSSNIYNMQCISNDTSLAPAGTIQDPYGFSPYPASVSFDCAFAILSGSNSEFVSNVITVESLDLGVGDSLFIYESNEPIKLYSGATIPAPFTSNSGGIMIYFKTNGDASNGDGFKITWRGSYKGDAPSVVKSYNGRGFVFDTETNSIWSGFHSTKEYGDRGVGSTAFGNGNNASGPYSMAFGIGTEASNYSSAAFGHKSIASGSSATAFGKSSAAKGMYAFAAGHSTIALGEAAVAFGNLTEANGLNSFSLGSESNASGANAIAGGLASEASGENTFAFGQSATASGDNSAAIGTYTSTNNKIGALVFGDNVASPADAIRSNDDNRLSARFDNGYEFYTNSNLSSSSSFGIMALHNANSWSSISDSTKKENFIPSNGEKVLNSVAQMRVGTWNYKTQDSSKFRHWGVMAQDFYKHFGKDAYGSIGSDTLIASADFDGVAFAAIKALEERTRILQAENKALMKALAEQAAELKKYASIYYEFSEFKEMMKTTIVKNR